MPKAMINRLQGWNNSMAKSLWEKGRSGYTMGLQALSGWECIMSHPDPRARTDTPQGNRKVVKSPGFPPCRPDSGPP